MPPPSETILSTAVALRILDPDRWVTGEPAKTSGRINVDGPRMTTARGFPRLDNSPSIVPVTMDVPVIMAILHSDRDTRPSSGDRVPGLSVLSSIMSRRQPVKRSEV